MNMLHIIGNLTADPVTNTSGSGKTVCNFTVAVNRRKTQQNQNPEADFFRVGAWGVLGENCQKFLSKGRKVAVVGNVSVNTYQAQDGSTRASMNVFAQEVEFLPSRGDAANSQESGSHDGGVQPNMTPVDVNPDDLPF